MPFARIATAAAVTVSFALAGCDHAPARPDVQREPAATAVPRETATATPPPADLDAGSGSAGLDRFVAAVQRTLPRVALDRRDEEVEELGKQACDALRSGGGTKAAAGTVADEGVTASDSRTLVALARDDLCRS